MAYSVRDWRDAELDSAACDVQVSCEIDDPEWDAFLTRRSGGHHVQGTLWARVKATAGWNPVRIVLRQAGRIVGGVQILEKRKLPLGLMGYAPKGPVFDTDDPAVTALLAAQLKQIAHERNMRMLLVQPLEEAPAFLEALRSNRFVPSVIEVGPLATVVNELHADAEQMMQGMHKKTRAHIRRSQRKGIVVRQGTKDDLPAFHELLTLTSKRQGFTPEPIEFYYDMWDIQQANDSVELFVSEYENEAVSAALIHGFGDTAIYKRGAWSGAHGDRYPNEAMHWAVMQWAQAKGYRYYDFEGIDPVAARTAIAKEPLPEAFRHSLSRFKLNFGGVPEVFGQLHSYVPNPLLRFGMHSIIEPACDTEFGRRFVRASRS